MAKAFFLTLFLVCTTSVFASSGILFLAHGSMQMGHGTQQMACNNSMPSAWEKAVLNVIDSIKPELAFNAEVSFGMWNSRCIDAGIARLEGLLKEQGQTLEHLIVMPIFISSHSAVIEMQKYIFKKRADRVIPLPMVTKANFNGKITYLPALDYNPQISMILADRFHDLIYLAKKQGLQKKQMELVLVMHGPVSDKDNAKWLKMGREYIADIMYLFPVSSAHVISLRDDARGETRERATKELQGIVSAAAKAGKKALVLPLLLSKGGIETGILERLEGLDYIWAGKMLLPDEKLGKILVERLIPRANSL